MKLTAMIEANETIIHDFKRGQGSKQPGGAQKDQGIGVFSFLAALSSGFTIFTIQLFLFLLLRNRLGRVFKPKSSLTPQHEQPEEEGTGFIPRMKQICGMNDQELIRKCGLDAYFFLRYLKTILLVFLLTAALAIPSLIPLNYVGGRGSQIARDGEDRLNQSAAQITGLDTLTWANVKPQNSQRYWAHLLMAIVVVVWTCAIFFDEMREYVRVRQDYLTSTEHRLRPSSSTILVNSIPNDLCQKAKLKEMFSVFPGGVKNVWINRDFRPLLKKIILRNAIHQRLEAAETDLIKASQLVHQKRQRIFNQESGKKRFSQTCSEIQTKVSDAKISAAPPILISDYEKCSQNDAWARFLDEKDRPTHRIPRFGWDWLPGVVTFGRKEDTIYWCRRKLEKLNSEIKCAQDSPGKCSIGNSAFIQFHSQLAAHMACQSEVHHQPEHMTPKVIGFCPEEIIWNNVALKNGEEWIRAILTYSIVFTMISLWSIPVAWTGALSQVDQLIQHYDWLTFLEKTEILRSSVSAIAGILPTAILAILLYILPSLLEVLAEFKGVKTLSLRDEFVQQFYFVFLFIQLFLVVSIASFFTTSIRELAANVGDIQRVSDLLDILARNLPKASNYFFSYMILQSLSTSSATLLQISSLFEHYAIAPLVDRTARDIWTRRTKPRSMRWGSIFPVYTNFACIALVYCITSPLISAFAILLFGLLWITQRYTILCIYQAEYDAGGVLYPRAINQTFTGLYVMELCLAGLFFIVKDERGRAACTAQGIIMVLVLVGTVLFQVFLNWRFGPLLRYLPVKLGDFDADVCHRIQTLGERRFSMSTATQRDYKVRDMTHDSDSAQNKRRPIENAELSTKLQESTGTERDDLEATAFDHVALRSRQPTVWIPKDNLGVSEDEIRQTNQFGGLISISSYGATLGNQGNVLCQENPPDLSKFARVKL
ncbi:related to PHM7-similarity to A.thaliana hyp1 protein [Fusarium mangiferae]|uniref:Related to PHM7-similarity to A.thaliana hyp1 protein n=1 Tax=Fusarium mangiferae TaxID=192010 RepID=A0A1L7UED0_FUSMA|nr:uncharacterized protein FMAN_14295 [Fusarium mangiferae]CVL09030.1 related to PHM7-similarity to A.thaliana hyp1 protein [Fusarium mangiferae]